MDVLQEILGWSSGLPKWQRDALRRILVNGDLSDEDITEVTEICKRAHGLSGVEEPVVLAAEHIPDQGGDTGEVFVDSIYHHQGVNNLAQKQTLKFGPNLTIVYGDNGAGKTGYIRILKSACRARGVEDILGNVTSEAAVQDQVYSLKYKVGHGGELVEWTGNSEDDTVSQVSVFDTNSAAVYLAEKTDVAFRPVGLDLFDKLVKACKAVRGNLATEKQALLVSAVPGIEVPEGTVAAKLLSTITSLTNPDAVTSLATFSEEEKGRVAIIRKKLTDLQSSDPEKLSRELNLRSQRLRTLSDKIKSIESALSEETVKDVFKALEKAKSKKLQSDALRGATFGDELLEGTGSDAWMALWEAARAFSNEEAYPGQKFPAVEDDALCVLCQQGLDHDACKRLMQFEKYIRSSAETEFRAAIQGFREISRNLSALVISDESIEQALAEVRIEDNELAEAVKDGLAIAQQSKEILIEALKKKDEMPDGYSFPPLPSGQVEALCAQLDGRAASLLKDATPDLKDRLNAELNEFRARAVLAKNVDTVLNDIERQKKVAAYGLCENDTRHNAVTVKSTEVTKAVVTEKLKESFKSELKELKFRHINVELKEAGGEDGNLYHRLILTNAPGINLPKVASEGEQRCLSIAAFFAELSTADNPSAIIFDDPVSSLDYKWRENVAMRLVREAEDRQVIIFTHDIVFLLYLHQFAEQLGVEYLDQHIFQQSALGAGLCSEELPWVAMKVSKRIGVLKNNWQEADKLFRDGHQNAYERDAIHLYGLLRETWERALEEVLLLSVVERFRPGVQTQQIGKIADITPDDCAQLEVAMTKTSKWLPGHDMAGAAHQDVPDPQELKGDIDALDNWVKAIRQRRQ